MPKKTIPGNEQMNKIQTIMELAKKASESSDFIQKVAAVTLYAGLVDFYTIQAARLVEQIILKGQLAQGQKLTFSPSDDSYFYDEQIDTRRILGGIKDLLPFKSITQENERVADKANELTEELLKRTHKFLNYRNTLVHNTGNPKKTLESIIEICDKAIEAFQNFLPIHKEFFETLQPFRFGEKELRYFYGNDMSR